jgi:hypothetical protein
VPEILTFDLLKTDFEQTAAYPTRLLYNPLAEARKVCMPLHTQEPSDVLDAVSGQYLARNTCGSAVFTLQPDTAVQAVILPAGTSLIERDGNLEANGTVVRYAAAWLELPGVEEYALLREGDLLPLTAHLPAGDQVISCTVTLDGQTIAEATGTTEPLRLTRPESDASRSALNITVQTAQGRKLSLSRSIQVLPADAQPLLQLTGAELKKAFPRTDNCRVYQEETGIRLKITKGSSAFRMPMMTLTATKDTWAVLRIPTASAAWGVQLYVNNLGAAVEVLPEWQRTGEYLLPLGDVLRREGLEQANVRLVFFLSSGDTGEVTLEELTVYAQAE